MKVGTFKWAERQVDPVEESFFFILYVAGNLPNSVQAVWNMKAICGEYFAGNYELEVVDVFTDPQRGLRDAILAIPTLVKLKPDPKQPFGRSSCRLPDPRRSIPKRHAELTNRWYTTDVRRHRCQRLADCTVSRSPLR